MKRSGGTLAIGDLAAGLQVSRQHLATLFQEQVGIGPKAAARVMRFEGAIRCVQSADRGTLAAIAEDHGYYDQAHMDRDFVALAGKPASTFLPE